MKKNYSSIFVFVTILACIIYLVQFGIDMCYHKKVNTKFTRLMAHKVDAEIMVFGSSVAYHGIDPEIIKKVTGKTAYNMGWDGLFFVQYNGLIKEYLSYQQKNKYIVLTCDFENLDKNELITRPDLFLSFLGNRNVYNSLREIEPEKVTKALYVPGYKFTLLNKSFYNAILFPPKDNSRSGYLPVENISWQVTSDTVKPFKARYNEHIYTMLKTTVEEITEKGVKVVLVVPPVYEEGYRMITNAEYIKAKYRSLAGKDVYFIDHSQDEISRSKDNFVNYSHLNPKAATAFSYALAKDLQKIIEQHEQ